MIERMQFDMGIESRRFQGMIAQGISRDVREAYATQEVKTDIGERLDRAESHYVYEIKEGNLYGQGIDEPFVDVIDRGIIQRWNGSRENAELIGFRFIESYMTDPTTPDGAIVFNPSPPDGENYNKYYLDVHKKVGNEVHSVRYFSDLTNEQHREKILEINPMYADVIPENPKDTDFFLNPVVVPNHLKFNPDQLASYIHEGKRGMNEEEFERIWNDPNLIFLRLSIINTLAENPLAISTLVEAQKAFYAGARRVKDGEYKPKFSLPKLEIKYLASQKETLGGGGCGSGACSLDSSESVPTSKFDNLDGRGPLSFRCPDCKKINTRELFKYVSNCQECGSDKVLPPSVKYLQA